MARWRTVAVLLAVGALVFVLWASLSYLYWRGEGSPGTPAEFRARVAERGLEVDWTNNGPTAGDGLVRTDCGPVPVTVAEVGGNLVLSWGDRRDVLGPRTIDELLRCR